MDAELIIKDEAKKFSWYIGVCRSKGGAKEFKSKLETALFDYDEAIDKLIFLYTVVKELDQEYDEHLERCEHKEAPEKCDTNMFYLKCKFFIEQEIRSLNPSFEFSILRPNINSNLIKQNLIELKDFPEAAKLFQSAMDKLNESRFERNLLDDLRLSLELLLKGIFNNSKSLENQLEEVGKHLKQGGTSKELNNMFRTLVDYYSKYQNSYIKHNDSVKEEEVDLMINLTSSFINFILKIK